MSEFQTINQTLFHQWAIPQDHLSCERLLGCLLPVTNYLQTSHSKGKAHGGITPESLIMNVDTCQIDLSQFQACDSEHLVRGTAYTPPEADTEPPGLPTVQADIYSLAAVLYHALTAQPPVAAAVRVKRGVELAIASNFVTQPEEDALRQALSLDPAKRPSSVAEFEALLRRPVAVTSQQPMAADSLQSHSAKPSPPAPGFHQQQPLSAKPQRDWNRAVEKPAPPPEPKVPKVAERVPMNLTKGKLCEIPILSLFPDGGADWQVKFQDLDELGLRLSEDKSSLVGIPIIDGEHVIRVQLHKACDKSPGPSEGLPRSIKVTINPDPAAIWKNLDSNRDDPFWKPDTDKLALPTPAAFIVAASVRGRSHAQEALFRDDDFRITCDGASGWHFIAVADGAGSAKLSRRGSQLACAHAIKHMEEQLRAEPTDEAKVSVAQQAADDEATPEQLRSLAYTWLGGAAQAALKAINDEAEGQEPPRAPKEYATTLLLAAARRTAKGWLVLSFGIGDGGIGLLKRDGSVQVMSTPDSGEFSSETIFLTSKGHWYSTEGIAKRLHVAQVPDFHALVLMTDGITDPLFPTEVSLGDRDVWLSFWTDLWKQVQLTPDNAQADAQLLAWAGFYSKGNHDDRTIALLLPNEPVPEITAET